MRNLAGPNKLTLRLRAASNTRDIYVIQYHIQILQYCLLRLASQKRTHTCMLHAHIGRQYSHVGRCWKGVHPTRVAGLARLGCAETRGAPAAGGTQYRKASSMPSHKRMHEGLAQPQAWSASNVTALREARPGRGTRARLTGETRARQAFERTQTHAHMEKLTILAVA